MRECLTDNRAPSIKANRTIRQTVRPFFTVTDFLCHNKTKMSSRLRQRCTTVLTCLAIAILVVLIVTVWVMLSRGAFRPKDRRISATRQPQHYSNVGKGEFVRITLQNAILVECAMAARGEEQLSLCYRLLSDGRVRGGMLTSA